MKFRVFLVEDDTLVAELITLMLDKEGIKCVHANSIEKAFEIFKETVESGNRFDLAIIDLVLNEEPDGGVKVLEGIRKLDKDVKAILCSGSVGSPVFSNFRDYGFDKKIAKPFTKDSLIQPLKEILM